MTLMEPKGSPPLSLTQVEDHVDKAKQEDPHAKEVHRRPRIVVIGLVPLKRAEPVRMSNAGGADSKGNIRNAISTLRERSVQGSSRCSCSLTVSCWSAKAQDARSTSRACWSQSKVGEVEEDASEKAGCRKRTVDPRF